VTVRASALRIATDAIEGLRSEVRSNVLPVTAEQWRRSVAQADLPTVLDEYAERRRAVLRGADAEGAAIGRDLRPAAVAFASAARDACSRLEILAALAPEGLAAVRASEWRSELASDALTVISELVAGGKVPELRGWIPMPEVPDRPRDVLLIAFGVPAGKLEDASGSFSAARLLAAYRRRLPILERACDSILTLIADKPPSVFAGLSCARDLVTSPCPFVTVATAREVRRMILDTFASTPDMAVEVLVAVWEQLDKQWSTRERVADRLRRVQAADTERERQIALVEAYKHMVEGLTRRWVWLLLRLNGLSGETLTVGQMLEPALSRLGPIGQDLKRSLLVLARNAEAHEELEFDDDAGVLIAGGAIIDNDQLASCFEGLDVLQRGWENGVLSAIHDCPELTSAALERATRASRSVSLDRAKQRFGHAGQIVRKFQRDGQRVDVEIENLRADACNPCFVALVQSAVILPNVSRFVVHVGDPPRPVIDLPVAVLQANWPVFVATCERFPHSLPQSTFVPCLTWVRLVCEPVEDAAAVAAWMILNDSQHAIIDASMNIEEARALPDRLRLAAAAGVATISLLPCGSHMKALEQAVRVAESTAFVAARKADGIADDLLLDRVLRLRDRLELRPTVLPTLDPTPLADSQYPHPVS
jgi:hypothetical protein